MQRDTPPHDDSTETIADGPRQRQRQRERDAPPARLGRYMIVNELGRGGMSVVYVAYDPELDRRVALKVVRGDRLSKAHRARLHREAQALARLSHPNVVTVFDVGDFADDTFVAMELIEGASLREWLKTPRTWREVVRVIVAAGRGLAAAHAGGIVHRDVKPDNIVIADSGTVKLVDFGLARDLGDRSTESGEHAPDDLDLAAGSIDNSSSVSGSGSSRPLETITRVGNVVGTPAYMPPEARSRRPESDERSDQFSLCASLYEALYGVKPFVVSRKRLQSDPTVVDEPDPAARTLAGAPPPDTRVPVWLQRVVTRGLAVEPSRRYPSVDALLVALDRDPQRTRRRVAAAAGALLAVAGVAIYVTTRVMPAQHVAAPTCDNGDKRLAEVWSPARLQVMKRAATQAAPWTAGAVDMFASRVEAYGSEWRTMYKQACEATRLRLVQSEEALDLRMACLARRIDALGELVTLMQTPTTAMLRNAGSVVDNLPKVAECADVKALRQVVQRPANPEVGRRIDVLETSIARMQALYAVGDAVKTIELADRVIADVKTIGYAPVLAQALYWRGRALADRGSAESEQWFDQTFAAALAAGHDQMAADAASRIAQEALWGARLPEFERWQRVAHSLATRTGAHPVIVFNDQLGCMAKYWYGKNQTRLRCLQELASRPGVRPNEWLVTTLGIAASEAGRPAEAIRWLEQGVALALAENGADHPRTLEMRGYLCQGFLRLGDYQRAAGECRDALARLAKSAPDDKLLQARLQLYLGEAEIELMHPDVAHALLESAAAHGDDEVKLEAKTDLSRIAGARGRRESAVAQQRTALAETIKMFGSFNEQHPNIVAARQELAVALLAQGDAKTAAAELARADADADLTEMSPLAVAQLRFARAEAVLAANPTAHDEARKLASGALELYVREAPDTERFRNERSTIEAWIRKLDGAAH